MYLASGTEAIFSFPANVTACDRFDVTPLHTAAERGHEECLVLLLEGEAECNINTKYSKHGSYTGKLYSFLFREKLMFVLYTFCCWLVCLCK